MNTQSVSTLIRQHHIYGRELYLDLDDPQSEISRFVQAFFLRYLVQKAPSQRKKTIVAEYTSCTNEREESVFLQSIDPQFELNFQKALTKEIYHHFMKLS